MTRPTAYQAAATANVLLEAKVLSAFVVLTCKAGDCGPLEVLVRQARKVQAAIAQVDASQAVNQSGLGRRDRVATRRRRVVI